MPLQTRSRSRDSGRAPTKRHDPVAREAGGDETHPLRIDLPVLAAAFSQRLHEADLPVSPSQSQQFALSLELIRPDSLRRLYFTTRAIFVTEPDQAAMFDRIFGEVFGARVGRDRDGEVTIEPVLAVIDA